MTIGLVGRKCGMTRIFTDAGETVPVTVIETRQEKSVRWYVVELAFGDLKPGTHTLTIAAKDTSGAQANASTAGFTVK